MLKLVGFSDPFCVVQLGSNKAKTNVKRKTLNPKWGETLSLPLTGDTLLVSVWDWDVMSSDDFLGEVKVSFRGIEEGAVWYTLQPRDSKDVVKGEVCMRIRISDSSSKSNASGVMDIVHPQIQKIEREAEGGALLDLCGLNLSQMPPSVVEEIRKADVFRIDLSFNFFTTFPEMGTIRMKHLNLSGNSLTSLPPTIGVLTALQELVLNGNQLVDLPPELGQLQMLEKLELGNNQLVRVCPELGLLCRLEELSLTGNKLGTLPPHIGGLFSLEVLDVSSCAITNIPEEFTLMTRLIELNLGNNKLKQLPEGIGRMTRLANLNLMDNQLTDLPITIGYCCGLGKLGSGIALARNPIRSEEMVAKYTIGTDHLLDYLEKRLAVSGNPEVPPVRLPEDLFPEKKPPPPIKTNSSPNLVRVDSGRSSPTPVRSSISVDAQLDSKVVLLKNWGLSMKDGTIVKLQKLKNGILKAEDVGDVVALAQQAKPIRTVAEMGKDLVPHRVTNPNESPHPTDKVEALKIAVATSLDDIIYIIDELSNLLENTKDTSIVISCVGVIKGMKPLLEKV